MKIKGPEHLRWLQDMLRFDTEAMLRARGWKTFHASGLVLVEKEVNGQWIRCSVETAVAVEQYAATPPQPCTCETETPNEDCPEHGGWEWP